MPWRYQKCGCNNRSMRNTNRCKCAQSQNALWRCRWINCGHLSATKATTSGCGLPSRPKPAISSGCTSATGAPNQDKLALQSMPPVYRQCAVVYSDLWSAYAEVNAQQTAGVQWAKKQEKPATENASIAPCVSACRLLFVTACRYQRS